MDENFDQDDWEFLIEQIDPAARAERELREYEAALQRLLDMADQRDGRKPWSLFKRKSRTLIEISKKFRMRRFLHAEAHRTGGRSPLSTPKGCEGKKFFFLSCFRYL